MANVTTLAADIERRLVALGDPKRAEGAGRYLKSELAFLGVRGPVVRAEVRAALAAAGALGREAVVRLAERLWHRPVFDLKGAAVAVLETRVRSLSPADLGLVETLLRSSHTWALVDWLATKVAAPHVERFPELAEELDHWASDGEFWLRRAAMLALLPALRRGAGDFDRFSRYADAMLEEKEFFIRKAIGWVLREVGKKRPELVAGWLEARLPRVSGLTLREAVRWLPPPRRAALLGSRRPRRVPVDSREEGRTASRRG